MYADASVPEATARKAHGKKKAGKQKENISRLPLRVQNHELPEEELVSVFGENGWKRLPDKVYLKVEYLPARQECVEHHIAIYAGVRKEDKANNLKPYEYFRFLLDEIAEHLYGREYDPNDRAFLNDLLPWSDKLPDICKKKI